MRELVFDPATARTSWATRECTPLSAGWIRVRIESVLLSRCTWESFDRPIVPGGGYSGIATETGPDAGIDAGRKVLSVARTGSCADEIEIRRPHVFQLNDDADLDDAVVASVPGIRAHGAVSVLIQWGVSTVAVVGASGATGAMLGILCSSAGMTVHGVTASSMSADTLISCGYASVTSIDDLTDQSAALPFAVEAVVNCRSPSARTELVRTRIGAVPWIAFPGFVAEAEPLAGVHVINPIQNAAQSLDEAIASYNAVMAVLAARPDRFPSRIITFDDVPRHWATSDLKTYGALILHPAAQRGEVPAVAEAMTPKDE